MICPLCEQGGICVATIKRTETQIFICEECDAIWDNNVIKSETALTFENYMTSMDLPPLWSELTNISYL